MVQEAAAVGTTETCWESPPLEVLQQNGQASQEQEGRKSTTEPEREAPTCSVPLFLSTDKTTWCQEVKKEIFTRPISNMTMKGGFEAERQ